MSRQISRSEAWEKAHQVFTQVNFTAFDFDSIKESLIDYIKLYFPEDFSDYIESSEFIAILEMFAYVGELLSYRIDMNAHENFITTAQRKESILRLAKLISYKASRNIPARGLVKLSSVTTTETVIDSSGRNLAGRQIFWNDVNNPDWKEQFILVMNRVLEQEYGTVTPNERIQMDDVLLELYTFNNNPISTNGRSVLSFSTGVDGESLPMELVPTTLTSSGPEERRPEMNAKMSLMYANDGLGDSSSTTGFVMMVKQGTLAFTNQSFDGLTSNQTLDVNISNINDTDVWLNNINPDTNAILTEDPFAAVTPHLSDEETRYGEWAEVDLANAQNIIFNTSSNRRKYEVETLDEDQIRLIFGDGEFSDIPSGSFHLWYRTSANKDLYVPKNAIVDQSSSISYTDITGSVQTLSFTFSLTNALQNASASEDIEHIRRVAPATYYTQDRMVNGRDYNSFMLQDPSVLRLRAINRTFAGDSKYIHWHDPSGTYEDVKVFGDDMALYWNDETPETGEIVEVEFTEIADTDPGILISNYIEPLLSSLDFFNYTGTRLEELGQSASGIRRTFLSSEITNITNGIDTNGKKAYLYYDATADAWTVETTQLSLGDSLNKLYFIFIESGAVGTKWTIKWATRRLVANSPTTQFWNTNTTDSVINFDTLASVQDTLTILKANSNSSGDSILSNNRDFGVLAQEINTTIPNNGLPDINKLSVLPVDINNDSIPDNLIQKDLLVSVYEGEWVDFPGAINGVSTKQIDLSLLGSGERYNFDSIENGLDFDVEVYLGTSEASLIRNTFNDSEITAIDEQLIEFHPTNATIPSTSFQNTTYVRVIVRKFVYFQRASELDPWEPVEDSLAIRELFKSETTPTLYNRRPGRYPLNFLWSHFVPRLNLVDPASSNIIDMFIITIGYYIGLKQWIDGTTSVRPTAPSTLELRTNYAALLNNKMISDTVIPHSGDFKILFGTKAPSSLQCTFKVIRPETSSLTDNQVKVRIVDVVKSFFDINHWEFGETFYFTELASAIHTDLGSEINSIVLVPLSSGNFFGDLFQVQARENELFLPDISTQNIEIIQSITTSNIKQS